MSGITLTELKTKVDKLIEDGYGNAEVISSHDGDVLDVRMESDGSLVTVVTEE